MKDAKRKLKNGSGMSLAETLMAVLILLLVSSVIAVGIPAAANAYRNAVDAANAQALLSTTVNALRSEFSTAWGVKVIDSENVIYYSAKTGAKTKLSLDGEPTVTEYVDYDNPAYNSSVKDKHPLVTSGNLGIKFKVEPPNSDTETVEMLEFSHFVVTKKDNDKKEVGKLKDTEGEDLSIIIMLLRPEFRVPELP